MFSGFQKRAMSIVLMAMVVISMAAMGHAARKPKKSGEKPADTAADTGSDARPAEHVKLPAAADETVVGGGGRYLVLHLKKLQQLAVFDVTQSKVVKYIPIASNDVALACSATKLFVGLKDLKQIQRWDLEKQTLELSVAAPEGGVAALAAGANAVGPLLMIGDQHAKRFWQVDPVTLRAERCPATHWGTDGSAWGPIHIHVSYDGTTGIACGGGWAGIELYTLGPRGVIDHHPGAYVNGDALVSGNGSLVFPDHDKIHRDDLTSKITSIDGIAFPADDAAFSLAFEKDRDRKKTSLTLFANSDPRPLLTLRNLSELSQDTKTPIWQRVHLIPSLKTLITLGSGGEELLVRKFDLPAELAAAGIDYLFVESSPVRVAACGGTYSYQMQVQSKKGGVKTELQSGPPGMTISADGKIQWPVPQSFREPSASVIVQVSDSAGQTAFHTFTIRVTGQPAPVAVAKPPTVSESPRHVTATKPPRVTTPVAPPPRTTNVPSAVKPPVTPPPHHPAGPSRHTAEEPSMAELGEVIQLPEPFREFHAANAGRTLVFYLQKARQLALYDAATGKPTGTISIGADDIRFACGLDCIVIALPEQKILQRYDLQTLQRTKSAPFPDTHPLKQMGMGNASKGPVYLFFDGEMIAADAGTLATIKHRGALPGGNAQQRFEFRVSADGSAIVTWDSSISPESFTIARLKNGVVSTVQSPERIGMYNRRFSLSADASLVLYETNIYNATGNALPATLKEYTNTIPTSDPRFFIAVKSGNKGPCSAALCTSNDRRVISTLEKLPEIGESKGYDRGRCGIVAEMPGAGEPRIVLLPDAKTYAVLPASNDRFVIIKQDMAVAAAAPGTSPGAAAIGNLAVVSLPPAEVAVDATYSYQIQVIPEKASVKYKVESAPEGLTVSAAGLVTWKPTSRPIGGKVNVILSITDAGGREVPHAFEIAVTRGAAPAPVGGAEPTGQIVKADEHRIELPADKYFLTPGMGGRMLLVCGNQLAILAPDGFTIQKTQTLPKTYVSIAERKDYYVALCQEPRSIDVIDKSTLKVLRTRIIAFNQLVSLALHPTRPISYVSYTQADEGARHRYLIFDELSAEARTDDNWLGEWLAVSADGRFMVAGIQETYQKGHDIIDNPDRIWIVPSYGSHDVLCRYDLDARSGIPYRVAVKDGVGGNGNGIRLSDDGRRVTYLSFAGYPSLSHNLGAWDPLDLGKLPVCYPVKDVASTKDMAFHPLLPLVACFGKSSVVFFNRETGERLENRINDEEIASETISRVYFSPDGKTLLLETAVGGVHYLYHLPLKLSAEESRAVGNLPRADKPMETTPRVQPGPATPGKLPRVEA